MIKCELIQRIAAKNPNLFQRDIEKIVNIILALRLSMPWLAGIAS
jgi:hypothetical protein